MDSVILRTATRALITLLMLLSIWLFLRGHNAPGGGFIGGLVGASAFALYAIAYGVESARKALPFKPNYILGLGLFTAVLSGWFSLPFFQNFLTGLWLKFKFFGETIKLGTPILFDFGVYLVVIGVVLTLILSLEEIKD